MFKRLSLLLFLLVASCGTEPTPFPVTAPQTPTFEPQATDTPPLRYAFSGNTVGYVEELDKISSTADVEFITDVVDPSQLGSRFELVATYGSYEGWNRSPVTPRVMLVVNPNADPLVPTLADLIRNSIQPQTIVEHISWPGPVPSVVVTTSAQALREELANLGYPDGVNIALGHSYVPGATQIVKQLEAINIHVRIVALKRPELEKALREGRIHLAVISWVTSEEQDQWKDLFGAAFTQELYNLPISYLAIPQLAISFTERGWPLGSWSD